MRGADAILAPRILTAQSKTRRRFGTGSRTLMMRSFSISLILLLSAVSLFARTRLVGEQNDLPRPTSVLWIAAHPDDEAVPAPLLAQWCLHDGAHCTFLTMTRGGAGDCELPNGCHPDLATVRVAEEATATQYFGADAIVLNFPDGGGVAPPTWKGPHGSRDEVVKTIAGYIAAVHPDLILTFDPRHGTTCHPDHREVGNIVLEAMAQLPYMPQLYLLESRVAFTLAPAVVSFTTATPSALRYDASETWSAVIDDMERHASQFPVALIDAVGATPTSDRAVYVAEASFVLQQSVASCP